MNDLQASRQSEGEYAQHALDQEQLVYALKRIDVDAANHTDVVVLAAALGLTQYISTQTQLEKEWL